MRSHQQAPPVFKVVQERGQRTLGRRCWLLGSLRIRFFLGEGQNLLGVFLAGYFALDSPSLLPSSSLCFLGHLVVLLLLLVHLVLLALCPLGGADFSEGVRLHGVAGRRFARCVLVFIFIR